MGKKISSISIETHFLQDVFIEDVSEDVTSPSASDVDPPAEEADGGIREPIPTKERNTNQLYL